MSDAKGTKLIELEQGSGSRDGDKITSTLTNISSSGLGSPSGKKSRAGGGGKLDQQAEAHLQAGTIWNAIHGSNFAAVKELVQRNPSILDERDAIGATPLHLCYLFNGAEQKKIGKWIMDNHGGEDNRRILSGYTQDEYLGETIMHLAIVNKDAEYVAYMVDKDRRLLAIPAVGHFFTYPSLCYYGEFPFMFAACTNNPEMVNLLLSRGGQEELYRVDRNGNTVLHLMIMRGLQRMFLRLHWIDENYRKEWREAHPENRVDPPVEGREYDNEPLPLIQRRNKEGLTPLTLAAKMGDVHMFEFLLETLKTTQWVYGPVACNLYPLKELDTLQPAEEAPAKGEPRHPSALEIIINNRHYELLNVTRIIELLNKKWELFARKEFYWRFFSAVIFVFVGTAAIVLRPSEFNRSYRYPQLETEKLEQARLAMEIFVLLFAVYKLYVEAREIWQIGWRSYWNSTGFGLMENVLCWCIFANLILIGLFRLAADTREEYFAAIGIIVGWTYLFVLLLGWKLTGPFVVMIFRMLRHDVARFIIIYVNILIGFSAAFYAFEQENPQDPSASDGPHLFGNRIEKLFLVLLGNIDFETFNENLRAKWFGTLLLVAYIILVTILLLNLLIAMMANTYNQVEARSNLEWLLAYAQIITEIEKEMSRSSLLGDRVKYWVNYKGARYMLCQEEDPQYFLRESQEEKDRKAVLSNPQATLAMLDKNFDGVIDQYEINMAKSKGANPRVKDAGAVLAALDADHDGAVSAAELKLAADESKLEEQARENEQAIALERAALNKPEAMSSASTRRTTNTHQGLVRQK